MEFALKLLESGAGSLAAYLAAHVLLCLLPAFFIAGAMAALTKVKESVTTDEQNIHFMVLARQARDKISEAAATNAEAAQAVMVLRALSTGGGR